MLFPPVMVDMKTWLSSRYTNAVLMVALIFNIEECFRTSSNVVAGNQYNSRGMDAEAINRHLMRLQQSLRLIRSPTPRSRFRPWGGKRDYKPLQAFPYTYSSLCSQPNTPLDPGLFARCSDILVKRDKFRPWGGKRADESRADSARVQNLDDPSSLEDYEENEEQRTFYSPALKLEHGMPELSSFDDEPNDEVPFVHNYSDLISPGEMRRITTALTQKADNTLQAIKRQRFNPWGGKRAERFGPWYGKRAQRFSPWAGKRGQRFSPWAGKRSQLHPFTDIFYTINDTIGDEAQTEGDQLDHSPHQHNEKSVRIKREALSNNLKGDDEYAGKDVDREKIQTLVKRSLKTLGGEGLKRIGTLSDILKKYESLVSEHSQRGFHPWAGKKRSTNFDEEETQKINSKGQVPVNEETMTERELSRIVKRNTDFDYEISPEKRQTFHPWEASHSGRETGLSWLDYPDFLGHFKTESKKTFNPWAGK